jgi:hypothetical protein
MTRCAPKVQALEPFGVANGELLEAVASLLKPSLNLPVV